jgi:hypothetical protein
MDRPDTYTAPTNFFPPTSSRDLPEDFGSDDRPGSRIITSSYQSNTNNMYSNSPPSSPPVNRSSTVVNNNYNQNISSTSSYSPPPQTSSTSAGSIIADLERNNAASKSTGGGWQAAKPLEKSGSGGSTFTPASPSAPKKEWSYTKPSNLAASPAPKKEPYQYPYPPVDQRDETE